MKNEESPGGMLLYKTVLDVWFSFFFNILQVLMI